MNLFGQQLNEYSVHDLEKDIYFFGEPPAQDSVLLSSQDTTVESYMNYSQKRAGGLGIKDAIEAGVLREATEQDYQEWVEANIKAKESEYGVKWSEAEKEAYRAELKSGYTDYVQYIGGYVVLKDFAFPAGVSATFYTSQGVPLPKGKPNNSYIFTLDTGKCYNACPPVLPLDDPTMILSYPNQDRE